MNLACSHCHTPLQMNETFCRNCGTLTGNEGPDPTLIIRRPSQDASSPWAKMGTHFAVSSSRPVSAGSPPITLGTFVTQDAPTYPPLVEEDDFERTRIVRSHNVLASLKGWLVAVSGPEKGVDWTIRNGKNGIGRTTGSTVLLQEDSISGGHAVLWLGEDGSATLVDRDSSNGTFVDGQQIFQPTVIQDGALIRCGEITTMQWVRFQQRSTT